MRKIVFALACLAPIAAHAGGMGAVWTAQCQLQADTAVSRSNGRWQRIVQSCMAAKEAAGAAQMEALTAAAGARADAINRYIGR